MLKVPRPGLQKAWEPVGEVATAPIRKTFCPSEISPPISAYVNRLWFGRSPFVPEYAFEMPPLFALKPVYP
jgi:hypothetical protein